MALIKDIFEYLDYRAYLKDFYAEKKAQNRHFSYRYIAQKVGFKSPGHFTLILQGKADISTALTLKFAQFMKLKKRETDYFELLVQFDQAKVPDERKRYFEKLCSFKGSKVKLMVEQQLQLFDKWYNIALGEALAFLPFKGDFQELAETLVPAITADQAREAVAALENAGLIRKNEQGVYERVERVLSTGYEANSKAVQNFMRATMDLAREAVDRLPRQERSISTLTLSLSPNGRNVVEEELKVFRRRLLEIAKTDKNEDQVLQVNFQIFPLTKARGNP